MSVPPPQIPQFDPSSLLSGFVSFWHQATFGAFESVLAGLFVLSVFLKTRSLSATGVALVVVSAVVFRGWMLVLLALVLAALLWALWERSA